MSVFTRIHGSHINFICVIINCFFLFLILLKIDFLVNNAGRSQRGGALDTELEVDQTLLQLNTIGTISLTKSVLPHMVDQGNGSIVVISSVAGRMGLWRMDVDSVCMRVTTTVLLLYACVCRCSGVLRVLSQQACPPGEARGIRRVCTETDFI